ncbi:hypothetical protein EIK77_010276 [Talaromyces pinophilus]|nr:hypothetical protein EIK77_010276 [Talaromyces pinophilus]
MNVSLPVCGRIDPTNTSQVTTFLNETYPTKTSAPEWSVTWQYTPFPESQPVHAYPNIEVHDGLPVTLSDLKSLNVDLAWSYSLGNTPKDTSDTPEFDSISLNTNVAIDMFFDSLEKNATDSTMAAYEIMVWFAHYGVAAQTIGNASGIVDTKVVNTTTLYVSPCLWIFKPVLMTAATFTTATTQSVKASSSTCTHGSRPRTRRRLPVISHHSSRH